MLRVWGIIRKKNKIIKDMVVEDSKIDVQIRPASPLYRTDLL